MLLGRQVPAAADYAPELLYPIPRSAGRSALGISARTLPFFGEDIWHAYEMSWLEPCGRPVAFIGRLRVPATSANIVESKSLKLYLNSLNNVRFADTETAIETILGDLTPVLGVRPQLTLQGIGARGYSFSALPGGCIDGEKLVRPASEPAAALLQLAGAQAVEESLFSHLLRSLCPVTGQPDWATLWVHYRGPQIDRASLLRYVVAYRNHQDFHEQCVERIFCDLQDACRPDYLAVHGLYSRRGGLDISPWRSSQAEPAPVRQLNRQ
jgi:7-cyano-7-deazaguanine reductase